MKIPSPKEYCDAYIAKVYDEALDKNQTIEVSLAFHAGVEAACKFIEEYLAIGGEESEDVLADRLVRFRKRNKARAMHINLTRYGETNEKDLN